MSKEDIVSVLMQRAADGDQVLADAVKEIMRLRRIVGEGSLVHRQRQETADLRKALNPKLRVRTTGLPVHEKVMARVEVDEQTGCWVWQGGCTFNGYARLRRGPDGKPVYCHRIMYEHHRGPVPEGFVVMHTCDNRRCVNPDHLQAGTQKENINDMHRKGRAKRSLLTASDVLEIRQMRSEGVKPHAIAEKFHVSAVTVYNILSGKAWAWVGSASA